MKNQALFSSKDKSKKSKCCLLQFLFGALRVKKNHALVTLKLRRLYDCKKLYSKFQQFSSLVDLQLRG